MEIDDLGPDKESEFRSLLRDLRTAVRTALRQHQIEELLLNPNPAFEDEGRSKMGELLHWRAVCLGYWLAEDIAAWAQALQPSSMAYLNFPTPLWVDVPAWYRGQAHARVVHWIRSLEQDEIWALAIANQMSWIFNQMDPVEAWPVIDADLKGAPGYPTREARSMDEWEKLLSPDTWPELQLSASVACICANADNVVDALPDLPVLKRRDGSEFGVVTQDRGYSQHG
jgi:hypothetical protein